MFTSRLEFDEPHLTVARPGTERQACVRPVQVRERWPGQLSIRSPGTGYQRTVRQTGPWWATDSTLFSRT